MPLPERILLTQAVISTVHCVWSIVATVLISLLQHHYQMVLSLIKLEKKLFHLEENDTVGVVLYLPTCCLATADRVKAVHIHWGTHIHTPGWEHRHKAARYEPSVREMTQQRSIKWYKLQTSLLGPAVRNQYRFNTHWIILWLTKLAVKKKLFYKHWYVWAVIKNFLSSFSI